MPNHWFELRHPAGDEKLADGGVGCNTYQTKGAAVWFKIAEDGLHSADADCTRPHSPSVPPFLLTSIGLKNQWAVTPLIFTPNSGLNYTVPACLKPGYYLVRHEIIALHSAYSEGGAQFYPGCHQLEVSGEGTQVPEKGLVGFPGAYRAKDKGILYNIYGAKEYKTPGPAIWGC
jgi:hypothetical protein